MSEFHPGLNMPEGHAERPKKVTYKKETDPVLLAEIERESRTPKILSFRFEGADFQVEYLEISPKREGEGKMPVEVIIPGFCASLIPFKDTVKAMAEYMPDHRIICLSPFDSGKSSTLGRDHSLGKMNRAYRRVFEELRIAPAESELTVIGHSRSDIVALGLAVTYPDLIENIVLVNGVSAKESRLPELMFDFAKHTIKDITPARFGGDARAAKRYLEQTIDFTKNMMSPKGVRNQLSSLIKRRRADVARMAKGLHSNVLILSGTADITDPAHSKSRILDNLPAHVQGKQDVELGGLHDAPNGDPERFAYTLVNWLASLKK